MFISLGVGKGRRSLTPLTRRSGEEEIPALSKLSAFLGSPTGAHINPLMSPKRKAELFSPYGFQGFRSMLTLQKQTLGRGLQIR
jgi:hypothetical protein